MQGHAKSGGPVIWITACGHGDEVGGIVVIQEVFKWLRKHGLTNGSVFAFPLMNPMGFETASRHVSFSEEDLNRSFPGDKNGSLAHRIAEKIFSTIMETNPAFVVDLHNDWIRSIPYALMDLNENHEFHGYISGIVKKTGLLNIFDTDIIHESLSFSLIKKKIPSITLELGESYVINEKNISYGLHAILSLLDSFGMIDYKKDITPFSLPLKYQKSILKYTDKPLCSSSGIIRFTVKPGELIKKGQTVARIYNIFGKLVETIKSQNDGIVLGLSDSSVAFPGMQVIAMAY